MRCRRPGYGVNEGDAWSGFLTSAPFLRTRSSTSQTECGFQFTSKLEGMFADLSISKDMLSSFQKVSVCPALPLSRSCG